MAERLNFSEDFYKIGESFIKIDAVFVNSVKINAKPIEFFKELKWKLSEIAKFHLKRGSFELQAFPLGKLLKISENRSQNIWFWHFQAIFSRGSLE